MVGFDDRVEFVFDIGEGGEAGGGVGESEGEDGVLVELGESLFWVSVKPAVRMVERVKRWARYCLPSWRAAIGR